MTIKHKPYKGVLFKNKLSKYITMYEKPFEVKN